MKTIKNQRVLINSLSSCAITSPCSLGLRGQENSNTIAEQRPRLLPWRPPNVIPKCISFFFPSPHQFSFSYPPFFFSFTLQHLSTWGKCNCILLLAIIPADWPHALFMLSNMACWIFKLEGILCSGSQRCGNYLLHKTHDCVCVNAPLCISTCVCLSAFTVRISELCCVCGCVWCPLSPLWD